MSVLNYTLRAILPALICIPAALAAEQSWHVAIGTGISQLDPDTGDSGLRLEDNQSTATGINLGLDINPVITAEVGFTNLGSASLTTNRSISYQAVSFGAVAYVFGEKESRFRQDGLSSYFRLGFSAIDNDTQGPELPLEQSDNRAFWLGLGAQWPIGRQWSLRGELTAYDTDASTLMTSLVWRGRRPGSALPSVVADSSPIEPIEPISSVGNQPDSAGNRTAASISEQDAATASSPSPDPSASAENNRIIAVAQDNDFNPQGAAEQTNPAALDTRIVSPISTAAGARGQDQTCYSTSMRARISQSACELLDGELAGLDFNPGTARITLLGRASLDRVAAELKRYPRVVIELQSHTQAYSESGKADRLSRERVVNVARYLVSQGVAVSQLRARSYGSARPVADNTTAAGRRTNDRLELRLL